MRSSNLPFSIKVRMGRAAVGWSQDQLAARAGVSARTIKNIEAGRHGLRGATVDRVVEALTTAGAVLEADAVRLRDLGDRSDSIALGAQ